MYNIKITEIFIIEIYFSQKQYCKTQHMSLELNLKIVI